MMDAFKKYQNTLIIVIVIVIGFVIYSVYFAGGSDQALTSQAVDPAQTAVEQELISLLLELRSITLDTGIFTNPEFQSLQDFSQQVVQEPVGRPNPFEPLGK